MPMRRRLLLRRLFPASFILLAFILVLPAANFLIPTQTEQKTNSAAAAPQRPRTALNCNGGLVYDDSSPDAPFVFSGSATTIEVTRFALPAAPIELVQVCLCWTRAGSDTDLIFDLMVYGDGGSGPGTLLQTVPNLSATGVSLSGSFHDYPVSLNLTANPVYIGARWDANANPNFGLCLDTSVAGSTQVSTDGVSFPMIFGSFGMVRGETPPPASIAVSGGNGQSTPVNSAFASSLAALVLNASGNPVPGAPVTFSAPGGGASGTFAGTGTATETVYANAAGIATSSTFIANTVTGTYLVAADTSPSVGPVNFTLTNVAGSPAAIAVSSGNGQATTVNNNFALPLVVRVTDAFGNAVAGVTVVYAAPVTGASATFPGGNSAITNGNGEASVNAAANETAGAFTVTADTTPSVGGAGFGLTNLPANIVVSGISGPADESATLAPSYTMVLSSAPASPVNVTITPDAQCNTSATLLTFDTVNWNTAQTVTVTAVDDDIVEATHQCMITHQASSGDGNFDGTTIGSVVVQILDNDSVGIIFGGTTVIESEGSSTLYTLQLNNALQISEIVTVTLSYNAAQISVTPTMLIFNAGNWAVPQSVTVTAVDDGIEEGSQAVTITHSTSSNVGGSPYAGLAIDLVISINDVGVFTWSPACVITDGRINKDQRWDCAPPVAVYCTPTGIDIWAVNPETSQGAQYLFVGNAEINRIGVPVEQNVTLGEREGVILSRLTTGEFQVNAWQHDPYWPGGAKPYVIIWDACPPTYVDHYTP